MTFSSCFEAGLSNLRLLTCTHFDKIINSIDIAAESLIGDVDCEESVRENISQIRENFIKLIKNIESFNLKSIEKDPKSYIDKISLLEKENLHYFDSSQLLESLLDENCFFIENNHLKNNRNKYPLGVLVVTDWCLPLKKLDIFK